MKAFLMYPDRDFDPRQILARREREFNARHPDEALQLENLLPWNEKALTQDLGLDAILNTMAGGDGFLWEVAKVALLSSVSDPKTILYRQGILKDCLENENAARALYQIALDAVVAERKNYWSYFTRSPNGIVHRSVDVLQMFVAMLRRLRSLAESWSSTSRSDGFRTLFAMLKSELSDAYFEEVEQTLRRLKFHHGVLISAQLGPGNKGRDYVLRKPNHDPRNWFIRLVDRGPPGYRFQLHPRDENGARALSNMTDRGLNSVADAVARSTDHILAFFRMLRTEMAFYIGCLNLRARFQQLDEPICLPAPAEPGQRKLSFSGLYDASLALTSGRKVVGNDLSASGPDLVVVTGANTGGKSTFLRSIGIAHLMMQAGMYAPAKSFASPCCTAISTHYKREEDTMMESGKWDEELKRMSEIIDHLRPDALVLFNESFASTNEREGSVIAREIVRSLLKNRVRVFFVTHLYHFAHSFYKENTESTTFLRAERRSDGTRPFKLVEGPPLQTSYGEDLYNKIFTDARPRTPDMLRA